VNPRGFATRIADWRLEGPAKGPRDEAEAACGLRERGRGPRDDGGWPDLALEARSDAPGRIKDVVLQLAGAPARRWILLRIQLRPTERGSGPPEDSGR